MPEDDKKKKGMTREEYMKKKATEAYAGPGTTLAPVGSDMRKMQDANAKKRAESKDPVKYNSITRPANIQAIQDEMEKSTFNNSDQKKFQEKGFFPK